MSGKFTWRNVADQPSRIFTCGYCGHYISSSVGYSQGVNQDGSGQSNGHIYICHHCAKPTYLTSGGQWPGCPFGEDVSGITDHGVEALYAEARHAYSQNAFTAAVLCCRKLLMHIAVAKGAKSGESFVSYVSFLADEGYVPRDAKAWVDVIRQKSNEANHEIIVMTADDARDLISFITMLLKLVFEFPSRIPTRAPQA